ncbi:MAG: ParA family protein [bacterium]
MYTIAVANQKGGCGKTTTAVNLAACLATKGCRVLLVDLDPQAQASTYLRCEDRNPTGTVFDTMLETRTQRDISELYVPISRGFNLLPSEGISCDDEARLNAQPNRETRLRETLDGAKDDHEFAVIDCPPTLGVLTRNALMASNAVLLTIETSFLALHGVGKLLNIIQEVRSRHAIRVFAVATMFDGRTSFSREVLEDMRGYFDEMMLSTVIRQSVRLRESSSHGEPIFTYARSSRGADDYRALTDELLGKIVQGIEEMKQLVPTLKQ